MQVCGVDDAGRGSLLGPLVIAGVSVRRSGLRRLSGLGVRDSKKLSPKRREALYGEITGLADRYHVVRIPPRVIDRSVRRHLLNVLEARYMARVVSRLDPGVSYVDSCDVDPARFGRRVSELAGGARIRSYHRADDRFVIVSAASILAKVCRDREIKRLQRTHDVGSGYPSDRRTVRFVKNYYKKHRELPAFARASWRTVRDLA